MKKIKIVTDSSITIADELVEKYDITVIPLSVMIDGTVYSDDELSGERFMELMAAAHSLPKTTQPPIGLITEVYDELGKDGYDILSIHLTSSLSGTSETARQASMLSHANVEVVDSDFIDQALAFQVVEAAKMAQDNASIEEILKRITEIRDETKLFVGLSSLDNLVKGGRVGRVVGAVSSFLNIKVVMELKNKELIPVAKGRGNKTFKKWLGEVKADMSNYSNIREVAISYAGNLSIAQDIEKGLADVLNGVKVSVLHTGSVIATHTGTDAFALMFYGEK
jgi:DegV family protein with EDD domain